VHVLLSDVRPEHAFSVFSMTACPPAVAITITRGLKVLSFDNPPSRQRVRRMLQATT